MIELRNDHWAVEVPDGAKQLHIETNLDGKPYIGYKFKDDELLNEYELIYINPGNWQIVCTSKEATEAQLIDVVRELPVGKRFENYNGDYPVWCHSRRDSLNSLLASKGCDVNKNYLILKKTP
jgi:hypothetical protein